MQWRSNGDNFMNKSKEGRTIFKVHKTKDDRYTTILNEAIRDKRLSFRATGLLCYLLSLPDDWEIHQAQIATQKTEGRDAVITAFKELRALGYLDMELLREKGMIVATIWNVYESPIFDKPNRDTEKPETAQPLTANPTLQKTDFNERKKEQRSGFYFTESLQLIEKLLPEFKTHESHDRFAEAWNGYYEHRKAKKSPLTERAVLLFHKDFDDWGIERSIDAINHSVKSGWTGIHEARNGNGNHTPPIKTIRSLE